MNELKELIEIVRPGKLRYPRALDRSERLSELYHAILTNKFESEEEAKDYFYKNHPQKDWYFYLFKTRLFDYLSDAILFVEPEGDRSELRNAHFDCYKKMAAFEILKRQWVNESAALVGKRLLKKSIKFHFTDITLSTATSLRRTAAIKGDRKNYRRYTEIVKKYRGIKHAEEDAEAIYAELLMNFSAVKGSTKALLEKVASYSDEMKSLVRDHESYWLQLIAFNVLVYLNQLSNNFSQVVKDCHKALSFFRSLPFNAPAGSIFSFTYHLFTAHLKLGDYKQANEACEQALSVTVEGSLNWVIIQYYLLISALHSQNFDLAVRTLDGVKAFVDKHKAFREKILILEAYVQFFGKIGKCELPESDKRFRLARFLNEVPHFSKDKRGMNINILLIQVLFRLQRREFGKLIDRMESLQAYCYRHLRKDDTFRSNCFIHMILQLEKGSFKRAAVERHAKKYWEKLQSVPLKESTQDLEVEPVKYEYLWNCVLEMLA